MTRKELLKHEGKSIIIEYTTKVGPQKRTGILYSVTQEVVIFWPFETEKEVPIKFKDIDSIKELKGAE